jgi:hypothetical protein
VRGDRRRQNRCIERHTTHTHTHRQTHTHLPKRAIFHFDFLPLNGETEGVEGLDYLGVCVCVCVDEGVCVCMDEIFERRKKTRKALRISLSVCVSVYMYDHLGACVCVCVDVCVCVYVCTYLPPRAVLPCVDPPLNLLPLLLQLFGT